MKQFNNLTILAIETSCDDTCIALIEVEGKKDPRFKILSNIVSSQVKIHQKWGGVYPTLAKREHQKNLPLVLKKALRQAQGKQIDLIAVTVGPGLDPCLWVGVNFAKELAKKLKLQIIPVNHIEAHIYANWLPPVSLDLKLKTKNENLFPAVCLIVSGGHTQLILMNPVRKSSISNGVKGFGKYQILGETRDDAAGECFDKIARILGLGYPGGPAIATMAAKVRSTKYEEIKKKDSSNFQTSDFRLRLPRPMIYQKNYDFSFSGLKTAVLYDFKNRSPKIQKSKNYIREMAKEAQQAVIDVLIQKTLKAAKDYKVKSIILGGGVAANDELRKQLKRVCLKWKFKHFVPPKNLCTDNAVMTAITAYFYWLNPPSASWRGGKNWKEIKADANLRIAKNL